MDILNLRETLQNLITKLQRFSFKDFQKNYLNREKREFNLNDQLSHSSTKRKQKRNENIEKRVVGDY